MEPDPTPAPMARASGLKTPQLATREVSRVMKTAPKSVPKTYMASTPRYWSESGPYFSETMANDGSRSREKVAPTVALPMRSSTASGRARNTVPSRWPISCSSSAGPALTSTGRLGPMLKASRATRSITATPTRAAATFCRSRPSGLNFWMDTSRPRIRPQTMGKTTIEPMPTSNLAEPMNCTARPMTRASRAMGSGVFQSGHCRCGASAHARDSLVWRV